MAQDIIRIQDAKGNVFYPQTLAGAVMRPGGGDVEQICQRVDLIPNPNLLINGGFRIYQELPGPYVTAKTGVIPQYTVDQWAIYGIGTMTRRDNGGVDLTGATDFYLVQPLETSRFDRTKPYTVSIEASTAATSGNNRLIVGIGLKNSLSGSFVYSKNTSLKTLNANRTKYVFTADFLGNYEADYVVVYIVVQGTATIYNAKLEQGNVATPFVLEDDAVELMRCMRYYWRPKGTFATHNVIADTIYLYAGLWMPVPMRTTPTVIPYEILNLDYPNNPEGYKFGAENWGAGNHVWKFGRFNRTDYKRVTEVAANNERIDTLVIHDNANTAGEKFECHLEIDARIR